MDIGRADSTKLEEGKRLLLEVATELRQSRTNDIIVFSKLYDNFGMYINLLGAGQKVEPSEIVRAFDIADSAPRELEYLTASLLGLAYKLDGNFRQAMSSLETASRKRDQIGYEMTPTDSREESLLDIYIQQDELERADVFFTELIAARDNWLPEDQPNRAFTRILLARALILARTDLDRAKSLLMEARMILGMHAMAPEAPKNEIAQLLAQIDE